MRNRLKILYGEMAMTLYVATEPDAVKFALRLSNELSRVIVFEQQTGLNEWQQIQAFHNNNVTVL